MTSSGKSWVQEESSSDSSSGEPEEYSDTDIGIYFREAVSSSDDNWGNTTVWSTKPIPVRSLDFNEKSETLKAVGNAEVESWVQSQILAEVGNANVEKILQLLQIESKSDLRIIGIWGMCGIGKTTIAERISRRISNLFDFIYFKRDLSQEMHGKEAYSLLDDFLSSIVGGQFIRSSFSIKLRSMEKLLQHKRVLVVLDDVDCFGDVAHLVGIFDAFGPGSRVIITSRSRDVLHQCMVTEICEVEKLDEKDSFWLFYHHSVDKNRATKMPQRDMLIDADGNPLALIVFGSLVCDMPEYEWRSPTNFKKPMMLDILNKFRRSYERLGENEKKIFLDIACFFEGMDKDHVADLLDGCGFSPDMGINVLVDKSLLTIVENRLRMHYLTKQMGLQIVLQESESPEWRSRMWNDEDIAQILRENQGTEATEGIFLDLIFRKTIIFPCPKAFHRMHRLRLLKIYNCPLEGWPSKLLLPQGLEYLPRQLRLLHWERYPLISLPDSFDPVNLIELNLPYSSIEKLWEGTKNLKKLKRMRLSHSLYLTEVPNLSNASNLQSLDLEGCKGLVRLPPSVDKLKKLVILNAKDCLKLKRFPSVVLLDCLEVLNLSGCQELENFPELPVNLKEVFLGGTAVRDIPSSIQNVSSLVRLDLKDCRRLEVVTSSICKLKFLEFLNLSGCSKLESFPEVPETMGGLRYLDLSRTPIEKWPSSISNMVALSEIRLKKPANFSALPEFLQRKAIFTPSLQDQFPSRPESQNYLPPPPLVRSSSVSELPPLEISPPLLPLETLSFLESPPCFLVDLRLQNAHIQEVPEKICLLTLLEVLDLSRNYFVKLPDSINQLQRLRKLMLSHCERLRSLPMLPQSLDYLDAHGCTSIKPRQALFSSQQIPSIRVSPKVGRYERRMLTKIFRNQLNKAPTKSRRSPKRSPEGFLKPPSLTICIPTEAYAPWLLTNRGSSTTHELSARSNYPWSLAFLIMIAFDLGYSNDAGLAIKCLYKLDKRNNIYRPLEKTFHCWSPDMDEPRREAEHTLIFYDDSLYEYLDENGHGNVKLSFEFYPYDVENNPLYSCRVEWCSVYMISRKSRGLEPVYSRLRMASSEVSKKVSSWSLIKRKSSVSEKVKGDKESRKGTFSSSDLGSDYNIKLQEYDAVSDSDSVTTTSSHERITGW